jgi:glycosyltransferase involved in cell wall biosynthesis
MARDPLRILMLPRYDAAGASSRIRMLQYISALAAQAIEVTVAPLLDDGYVDDLYAGKVSAWKVANAYARRVVTLLTARGYDAVWLEKELFPWMPAWLEAWLLPAKAAVVADYDDAVFHRYDQHRSRIVRWLLGGKIDQVMRRADSVTAGNEYLAERARRAGAPHVQVLPTIVDLERYRPLPSGPDADHVVIGWIGSPATAHYLHQISGPLAALASRHPIRCVAIGANADQLQGTPFEAWPWSEATEVELLRRIDIGIMPLPDAPWERGKCGYKLIQYMACGLPVVASPVGVNRDIVQAGRNGELAETSGEWEQALERLVSDPDLRRRMGAAGRRRVEETYSIQAQVAGLVGLFRDLSRRQVR